LGLKNNVKFDSQPSEPATILVLLSDASKIRLKIKSRSITIRMKSWGFVSLCDELANYNKYQKRLGKLKPLIPKL
jgi:hypothetical protein